MIGNKKRRPSSSRSKSKPQNTQFSKSKTASKQYFKQKPLKEKLKNIDKEDEEILSGSEEDMGDDDNIDNDEFFEGDEEKEQQTKNTKAKTENTDEKRLRLAKKLISQIGNDITKEDKDADMVQDEVEEVDDYLREQIKKEVSIEQY